MKKIRYYLVVISLFVTLGGLSLPVLGSSLQAASTPIQHTTSTSALRIMPAGICPGSGSDDC
jgi:hypothetical protein